MKPQTIVMIALAAFALSSCATTSGAGDADPTLQFQKLGAADPDLESEITERYEKLVEASETNSKSQEDDEAKAVGDAPRDPDDVTVLVGTMPEGMTMGATGITVEEGYDHDIVARFGLTPEGGDAYNPYDDIEDKNIYIERMKMLGAAADVDTLVVQIMTTGEYLVGANGYLVRTDPDVESDDTEPMPESGQEGDAEGGDDWM
ncbi:MAG: hypothetical protein ACOCV2_08070 [Persicimonas sp.]